MKQADVLAFLNPAIPAEFLEDISVRQLVLRHYELEQASLSRYLAFLGLDGETAREVVQESFLKLHEHLLAGGDRSNLRAWLFRVAHNLGRNAQTAFRASKTDALPDDAAERLLAANSANAEEEILNRERAARLRSAMEDLSGAQKICLVLRAQGLKYREIAEVLNLSVSTVGENVQRGLARLKEMVDGKS